MLLCNHKLAYIPNLFLYKGGFFNLGCIVFFEFAVAERQRYEDDCQDGNEYFADHFYFKYMDNWLNEML